MNIGHLPTRERNVVMLRAQEMTWAEIGRRLGLSVERARVLHQQAMHRLEEANIGRMHTPERFYWLERFGEIRIIDPPRITVRPPPLATIPGGREHHPSYRLIG